MKKNTCKKVFNVNDVLTFNLIVSFSLFWQECIKRLCYFMNSIEEKQTIPTTTQNMFEGTIWNSINS